MFLLGFVCGRSSRASIKTLNLFIFALPGTGIEPTTMRVQRAIQATRLLSQKERTFWDEDHQYCPMLTLMGVVSTAALDWYYEYCIQGYLGERGRCDSSTEIYHPPMLEYPLGPRTRSKLRRGSGGNRTRGFWR